MFHGNQQKVVELMVVFKLSPSGSSHQQLASELELVAKRLKKNSKQKELMSEIESMEISQVVFFIYDFFST